MKNENEYDFLEFILTDSSVLKYLVWICLWTCLVFYAIYIHSRPFTIFSAICISVGIGAIIGRIHRASKEDKIERKTDTSPQKDYIYIIIIFINIVGFVFALFLTESYLVLSIFTFFVVMGCGILLERIVHNKYKHKDKNVE